MAKKDLLTENTVRRFMKLADINHLSESFIKEEAYLRDEMPEDEMPEMPKDEMPEDEMPEDEMPEDEMPEMPEDDDEYSDEEEVDKVTFGPEDLEEIFKSFADSVNEIARSKGLPGDMLTVQNEDDGMPEMPEDDEMPEMPEDDEMPEDEDDEISVGESGVMYEAKLAESVASRLAEKFAKSKRAKRAKKRTNISEAEIDKLTENIFRRITNVGKKK